MKINDGNGIWDNSGLIDTLIVDCNTLVKKMAGGEYVAFCALIVSMVQKLTNLQAGIKTEKESMQEQIDEAQRTINDLLNPKEEGEDDVQR